MATEPFPKTTTFIKFGNINDYAADTTTGRVELIAQGVFNTRVTTTDEANNFTVLTAPSSNGTLQYEDPDNPGTWIDMYDAASTLTDTHPSAVPFYVWSDGAYNRDEAVTYYSLRDSDSLNSNKTYFYDTATGEPLLLEGGGAETYNDNYPLDVVSDQLSSLLYSGFFVTPDGEILFAYGATDNDHSGQDRFGVTDYYTLEDNLNAWADHNIPVGVSIRAADWNRLNDPGDTSGTERGSGWEFFGGNARVTCFTRGTLITTAGGPVAVEDLSEGVLVLTQDNGLQPIRWIGSHMLSATELQTNPKLYPIRIRAGVIGQGTPDRDLQVSPQHRVLVRSKIAQRMFSADEVLVAARHLQEIDGIEPVEDAEGVEYFHILFDQHEIIFSNGAETESLYVGSQTLKSLSDDARDEIFALFPELLSEDVTKLPAPARPLVSGRQGRKLATRHSKNSRELIC